MRSGSLKSFTIQSTRLTLEESCLFALWFPFLPIHPSITLHYIAFKSGKVITCTLHTIMGLGNKWQESLKERREETNLAIYVLSNWCVVKLMCCESDDLWNWCLLILMSSEIDVLWNWWPRKYPVKSWPLMFMVSEFTCSRIDVLWNWLDL